MIQMAILLQDYMLLVKLVVVCMEIIELAVIQFAETIILDVKQGKLWQKS